MPEREPTTVFSMPEREPMTVHYTELGPAQKGSKITAEWDLYRREVGRLLAEGYEGKHILIKGEEIIGIYDTHREAMGEGYKRYLLTGFLVHQILTRERVVRAMCWLGSCPTSR